MYSVIVPTLGRIEYLNELLSSILAQSLPPNEILVLLDNNDHCRKISGLISSDPSIALIFCDGLNLAEKRNFGASIAKYDNIIFSDDDDLWASTRGLLVSDALKNLPVCCHNYGKFGEINADDCSKLGKLTKEITARDLLGGSNKFGGGSSIASKRYIVLALPFSSKFRYCEDFEWWSRILLAGIRVQYLGVSLVKYRTHASNMTNSVGLISRFGWKLALGLANQSLLMVMIAIMIMLRSLFRSSFYLIRLAKKK
jgi:glycosyltransferase involved in cell wall biosynthesis